MAQDTPRAAVAEAYQALFLDDHPAQVSNRETAEGQPTFPEGLTHHRPDLGPSLGAMGPGRSRQGKPIKAATTPLERRA